MSQAARNRDVRYTVREPVEIETGVFLPAGQYPGRMEERGLETLSKGVVWSSATYRIELSMKDLASMGRDNASGLFAVSYDLARFITQGQIDVADVGAAEAVPEAD